MFVEIPPHLAVSDFMRRVKGRSSHRVQMEAFRQFDWNDPEFAEAQVLFLRAARAVDDRRLDLSKSLRSQIADKLEKCKIAPVKAGRLRNFVPVERADRLCTERPCRPG